MTATPSPEGHAKVLEDRAQEFAECGWSREAADLRAAAALIRELVDALKPFATSSKRDWDEDAPDDTEVWSSQGPGWSVSKNTYTVGDLRRAAKAMEAN